MFKFACRLNELLFMDGRNLYINIKPLFYISKPFLFSINININKLYYIKLYISVKHLFCT